jgi:PAS domain S-box-containing protein
MNEQRRASILLVDDEADNLTALSAVLEPLGRELVHASSGEEALALLLKQEFALILLDVRMPGLNGFETAALIKQREKTRHVPIIFVTAVSRDTEQVFRGYSEGAVDYLLKPYDPAVLRSKVSVFVELYEKSAALEESEQRFRTAFANAPSGMAVVSADGRLLQVNRALAEMFGRSQAELVDSSWEALLDPSERAGDRDAMRELAAGERAIYRAERRCLHAHGRVLLGAVSVSPMAADGRKPRQLIAQIEDVTEREQAERERAEAEAVAQMVRSLQTVSDAALTHLALDDLLPELLDRIGEVLGADSAAALLMDAEEERLIERATRGGGAEGVVSFAERVARARKPIVIRDSGEGELRSQIGAPLISEGEVNGVVHLGSREPNRFDDNDAALLALVADRAVLAIGNARLYEREHKIVETLQRSLLPARLPRLPGISVSARYLPGGADVGGDWYDAIALEDGGFGLAMGDVVGHGLEAAALMGELRNALRAYALEGLSPAEVVARVDRLVRQLRGDQMATLLYAVMEPDWSSLRFASAGHPPPLLVSRDGAADYLWDGRSTPLGTGLSNLQEGFTSLEDGSTLVLYTDGLVEVRGESLDRGLERLREAVASGPDEPDPLCDHVIDSLLGGRGARDDVALLALRTLPLPRDQMRLDLPTDQTSLGYARRMLARWLERAGATPEEVWEIQLASHEACANAIEHAYRFGEELVHLQAELADHEVALTVSDFGSWREPESEERGQGIGLMNALMDRVSVDGGPEGTKVELRRRLGANDVAHRSARPGSDSNVELAGD